MKVVKRDYSIQEFDISKIETSIINSANDIGKILNVSDVKLLLNSIVREVSIIREDKSNRSSYEISNSIEKVLKENGFKAIGIAYENYIK